MKTMKSMKMRKTRTTTRNPHLFLELSPGFTGDGYALQRFAKKDYRPKMIFSRVKSRDVSASSTSAQATADTPAST